MDETFVLTLYIKFFQLNNQLGFMAYFHQCGDLPDVQIHLKPFLVEHNTSRTCFSGVLSMIGITSIQIFIIVAIIVYFTNPHLNLADLSKGKVTSLMAG